MILTSCSFVHIAHNLRYSLDTYASAIYSHSSCPCALLLCYWCIREMDRSFKYSLLRRHFEFSFTPRRLYSQENSLCYPFYKMLGGPYFLSGQFEEKYVPRLMGIEHRFSGRPPRSQWSIYRNIFLHYFYFYYCCSFRQRNQVSFELVYQTVDKI
jgi:hypothetical protein